MNLTDAIDKANARATELHGKRLQPDERSRVAAALLAIAQQHQSAILILLANKPSLPATAFSLFRLLLETTARGVWVLGCATEEQVNNIIDGKKRQVDMASIFDALGKALSEDEEQTVSARARSVIYDKHWRTLSAYTHGYEQQIQRWLKTANIESSYSSEEIEELIRLSDLVANLAYVSALTLQRKTIDK